MTVYITNPATTVEVHSTSDPALFDVVVGGITIPGLKFTAPQIGGLRMAAVLVEKATDLDSTLALFLARSGAPGTATIGEVLAALPADTLTALSAALGG